MEKENGGLFTANTLGPGSRDEIEATLQDNSSPSFADRFIRDEGCERLCSLLKKEYR